MNLWHTLFFFEKQLIKNLRYLEQFYDMQLVTPREAAIAVKIDITICNTVFQVSFFISSFFSD